MKVGKGLIDRRYLFADLSIFAITTTVSLLLRLDGNINAVNNQILELSIATVLFAFTKLVVLLACGWYRRNWQYPNINEISSISATFGLLVSSQSILFNCLCLLTNLPLRNLPQSLPLLDGLLSIGALVALRLFMRTLEQQHDKRKRSPEVSKRVLIVGAGQVGTSLVRQMQLSPQFGLTPIAFVDDDSDKIDLHIYGLPVVGNRHKIPDFVNSHNIDQVIIAMPSAAGKSVREIVDICQSNNIPASTMPSLEEILNKKGEIKVESVREVRIEDLLRRDPIKTNFDQVSTFVKGKRILVTGAGGSIGSEICRQILRFSPAEIILLGKGENSIFLIQQELETTISKMRLEEPNIELPKLKAFICDIRNSSRLEYAFDSFHPEVIFHAAAHKHVPLMELNASEAISTNVFGTKNLIDLALSNEIENFVMISTDKAVNPTNVMGASKRVAEMIVLQAAKNSSRPYTVVRFGNVLGSRGSVVPTFKRQIAEGGPITITHPDIIRYFMTIPEAVQLVLQTVVLGCGGEVCMFDMGEPVKIVDLAKDLIHLSGYEVGKEIDIVYTGLRPGEKLFEELFIPGENYERTEHEKIIIVRNASDRLPINLNLIVEQLGEASYRNDTRSICALLERLVLGYVPSHLKQPEVQELLNHEALTTSLHLLSPKPVKELASSIEKLERLYTLEQIPHSQSTAVEKALKYALTDQQFRLYYQPIIDLTTKDVIGFESFLRWLHPDKGLIPPAGFIADLERTGLILPVGWWVIQEVCQQLSSWQQQFPKKHITISVNLSEQQWFAPDLVPQITSLVEQYKIKTGSLSLDIPESIVRKQPKSTVKSDIATQIAGIEITARSIWC